MPLNIPRRDSTGIASIIQLPDSSVESLIKSLINAPSLADPYDMAKHISPDIVSILGCPNRLLSVDRFLDSRCQSRPSCAWWRNIFKEVKPIRRPQWGPMVPSATI